MSTKREKKTKIVLKTASMSTPNRNMYIVVFGMSTYWFESQSLSMISQSVPKSPEQPELASLFPNVVKHIQVSTK